MPKRSLAVLCSKKKKSSTAEAATFINSYLAQALLLASCFGACFKQNMYLLTHISSEIVGNAESNIKTCPEVRDACVHLDVFETPPVQNICCPAVIREALTMTATALECMAGYPTTAQQWSLLKGTHSLGPPKRRLDS